MDTYLYLSIVIKTDVDVTNDEVAKGQPGHWKRNFRRRDERNSPDKRETVEKSRTWTYRSHGEFVREQGWVGRMEVVAEKCHHLDRSARDRPPWEIPHLGAVY